MSQQQRPWGFAFGLTGLALLATAGILLVVRQQEERKEKARPAADPPRRTAAADYVLTAQNLYEAFERSPERAAEKYGGRTIKLSGRVRNKGKDERTRVVYFDTVPTANPPSGPESFEDTWARIAAASVNVFSVAAYLDDNSSEPEIGQLVTVHGRCEGKQRDVVLSGCRITTGN